MRESRGLFGLAWSCRYCRIKSWIGKNLIEKVNGANGNLIFAPVFKLNEGKRSVFGMFNVKNNYGLPAIVCELRGGVGVGVGHVQRIAQGQMFRKNFLHTKRFIFTHLSAEFSVNFKEV